MANDTFNGSTPQEAADEIFGAINVVSGVAYNSDERTLSGVVDNLADDQYLKVGGRGFYTEGIKCDIDSAETRAIASANQYTDEAIASIIGLSIEGLSGTSGVSYSSATKMLAGRVDNVSNEGGYLKVDAGGFYVSGINSAIEEAKNDAIRQSSGAISAKNGVRVTEQDGVKTMEGMVDAAKNSGKFLNVGSGGFYVSGVTEAIGTAKQEAVSTAKQYTDEKVGQAITGSIANLSATGGVAFSNNTFSGVVDDNKPEKFLKVGDGGFYVSGVTGAIDTARQEAVSEANQYTDGKVREAVSAANNYTDSRVEDVISGSIANLNATGGVAFNNNTNTFSGVVDSSQSEKFLNVGDGGFYVSGVTGAIDTAMQDAISASTAYTNQEISDITNKITVINQNIEAISGETSSMADTAVTYSMLTADEPRPVLVKKEAGAVTGTGDVQFTTGLTVNNDGDLIGHNISAETVVTTGITANNLTTTSITYNGTALTEYVTNIVSSTTEDSDEKVKQQSYTGTAAKPVIINTDGTEKTGEVGFVTAVTVDGNGGLSAVSASVNSIASTSITTTNLSATAITYNGKTLNEYISETADDKNVSQEQITATSAVTVPIITRKPGVTAGTDGVAYTSGAVVVYDPEDGAKISAKTIAGDSINSGATDLSDLFVGTAATISGTGYLEGGGNLSEDITIEHKELHTATGETIPNTPQKPNFGGTFTVPVVSYDKAGHILSVRTTSVLIPTADTNTDVAVKQTSFTGNGSAYMVLHTGTGSSTTGVSYVTGVSSDKEGNLKSVSVSAGTISADTDIRGGNVSAGTISAATGIRGSNVSAGTISAATGIRGNNVSAGTISAGTSMVTSAMTANTISAGTNSADTAVTVTGVVEATKFVGIIDCGTYSGDTSN